MDPRAKAATTIIAFLRKEGVIMATSVAVSSIALGPAGLLLGSTAGGAGLTVRALMQSPRWVPIAVGLTGIAAAALAALPQNSRLEYITNLLAAVARLIVRLLQSVGALPASELRQAITYPPPSGRSDNDDKGVH